MPIVVEPGTSPRQPGWRAVLLVAAAAAAVVLGAAVLTSLLPDAVQHAIFTTPIAIVFLAVATGWHLWRVSRRRPGE